MERKLTLQQAAQLVIDCQNACNLSGLVHDFPNVVSAVWEESNRLNKGTTFVNTHPIVIMMVSKLADLSRYAYGDEVTKYGTAEKACRNIVEGKPYEHGDNVIEPQKEKEASAEAPSTT